METILKLIDKLINRYTRWRIGLAKSNLTQVNFSIDNVCFTKDRVDVTGSGEFVLRVANSFAQFLSETPGADNYVQFDFLSPAEFGLRPIRCTVQWADGEMPGEQNIRLRKEVEDLKEELKRHIQNLVVT